MLGLCGGRFAEAADGMLREKALLCQSDPREGLLWGGRGESYLKSRGEEGGGGGDCGGEMGGGEMECKKMIKGLWLLVC